MKICLVSDFDFKASGYFNISCSLSEGLAKRGHEIKAVGLGYNGEEHTYPFGIIPTRDLREAFAIIANLKNMWNFDVLLVALDVPLHEQFVNFNLQNGSPLKYVGIMPIEADPLCVSWALILMQMKKSLIISKFGTLEAIKVGVPAMYLPVGINKESWRPSTTEERDAIRKALGFGDDYIVLTVGYNQERKFLSRSMEIFAEFAKDVPNSKYVLVTTEQSQVGWKLRDFAQELGISDKVIIFERGMEFKRLWGIYVASDVFLLTSKAEGLGMILLEAMSVGLPCIGTNCTGIKELLDGGRGYLVDYDYTIRDPFGNGRRYYASLTDGVEKLKAAYDAKMNNATAVIKKASEFVSDFTWDQSVDILEAALKDVVDEQA